MKFGEKMLDYMDDLLSEMEDHEALMKHFPNPEILSIKQLSMVEFMFYMATLPRPLLKIMRQNDQQALYLADYMYHAAELAYRKIDEVEEQIQAAKNDVDMINLFRKSVYDKFGQNEKIDAILNRVIKKVLQKGDR